MDTGCQSHSEAEKERLLSGDTEIYTCLVREIHKAEACKQAMRHNWVESCTFRAIYTQNKMNVM